MMIKEIKRKTRNTSSTGRRHIGQASAAPAHAVQRQTCLRGSDIETTPRRWRVSAQSRCQVKYQRKSPGRRDAHARVARDLAAPLPADDAGVLRRPRRPGAAGLRLGPGEREARELRGDVYVGVALRRIATLALEAGRGRRVRGSVRCQRRRRVRVRRRREVRVGEGDAGARTPGSRAPGQAAYRSCRIPRLVRIKRLGSVNVQSA